MTKLIKKTKTEKVKIEKVLGECNDGAYLKCQMEDGTIKILPKEEVEK